MAGGYVLCSYESVKQEFPEFDAIMKQLENDLIAKAQADWSPLAFGGMYAQGGQFSKSTVMPELFRDMSNTTMTTWNQTLTSTGHQKIMSGANDGNIYEDYKVGLVGIAFLNDPIRISEIKMEIGDQKLVRMNIEEAMVYEQPAIIFEQPYIIDEEIGFDLYGYVMSTGCQAIKLIGLQVNRVPNKMQVTATGAALE